MSDSRSTMHLDDELLRSFMLGFFGYGYFGAPLWFVGAEEGGGEDVGEIARRLRTWHVRGRNVLEDLKEFHEELGLPIAARLQPTWKPLMVAVFTALGKTVTPAALLNYQLEYLGAFRGNTCLMERLPLPKRGTKDWPYAKWSSIPGLQSRALYQRTFEPGRVDRILDLIRHHEPPIVVFYGNRRDWLKRLPTPTERRDAFEIGRLGRTRWYVTAHATAWSNDAASRFEAIGADIRERTQLSLG